VSDTMLHGVLCMPPDLWDEGNPIDAAQRYQRYVEASDRIIKLEQLLIDASRLIDARPNGYWARLEEMAVRIKQELAE
jgi:hypothetical protein